MNNKQKLAIKIAFQELKKVTLSENFGENAFQALANAFPKILEELEAPIVENPDQLKFNFALDNSETTDKVIP